MIAISRLTPLKQPFVHAEGALGRVKCRELGSHCDGRLRDFCVTKGLQRPAVRMSFLQNAEYPSDSAYANSLLASLSNVAVQPCILSSIWGRSQPMKIG